MPSKSKKPCAYHGCPVLTKDRFCPEHKKRVDKQYERYQRDPETRKRYGQAWRRIRAAYIAAHPLCEVCEKEGRLTPVEEVHHIVPLANGGTHDPDNLLSVCLRCHSSITAREGGRWR